MSTTTLQATRIGTSDSMSLCSGCPIWPPFMLNLGVNNRAVAGKIFSIRPAILWLRFGAEASYEFNAGFCGPSYALGMTLTPELEDDKLTLKVEDDELVAGIVAGLDLKLKLGFSVETYHAFKGWKSSGSVEAEINIDFIGLLLEALKWVYDNWGKSIEDPTLTPLSDLKGYWGMTGSDANGLAKIGDLTAVPKLSKKINLVDFATVTCEPLKVVMEFLEKLGGGIEAGPLIWVGIPVKTSVTSVALGSAVYSNLKPDGKEALVGSTTNTPVTDPTTMEVTVGHSAGFDMGFGAYAEASALKIFSIGAEYDISLLNLLSIPIPHGKTYQTVFSNTIGHTKLDKDCDCVAPSAPFRVILDPAAS